MFKQTVSVLLAILLAFSLCTVAFAEDGVDFIDDDVLTTGEYDFWNDATPGEAMPEYGDPIIYFDSATADWGEFNWVAFHIWSIDDEDFVGFDWGAKKQRGTDEDGDGIWEYDLDAAGLELKDFYTYAVIFYNDNGAQTYNLLFGKECFGATAYCDDTVYENPEDSNKTTRAAFWEDIDPLMYGPELKITSIGNVVGTCLPAVITLDTMLMDFITNTMDNARKYSGKTDQEIIDSIGEGLGLTLEEVTDLIAESELEVEWSAEDSTIPSMFDPDKMYLDYSYEFSQVSGNMCFEIENGEVLRLEVQAAAEKPIACVKGYLEFDPSVIKGIDAGESESEDENLYFTVTTSTNEDEPGRLYFDFDLREGADYIADDAWYLNECLFGLDDDGNEIILYSLKGLDLGTVDFEIIGEEPGVYPLTCVLTDAVDVDGKVLMEDGAYTMDEFYCDTNFAVDDSNAIIGDADTDGEVTILDATAIQRVLAGLPVEAFDEYAADADMDEEVTILDATAIQRYLAGLPANENIGYYF